MLGRKIGVYGMGEIGRKIAARVAAFETEVGYFSRSKHDVPYQYFPTLDALADWCSVLMVAVRAGADTEHAVDANILQKLGKDGYIVNISRGSVIDQKALIAALTDQTIAGAGLDVYAKEPHAPDALTALPNVVLSPHIGGHTLESHVAMQNCVMANLDAFFAGKPLPYAVREADRVSAPPPPADGAACRDCGRYRSRRFSRLISPCSWCDRVRRPDRAGRRWPR